jgi:copper(I)-binding protein
MKIFQKLHTILIETNSFIFNQSTMTLSNYSVTVVIFGKPTVQLEVARGTTFATVLTNAGNSDLSLVRALTFTGRSVELHDTVNTNGVLKVDVSSSDGSSKKPDGASC